VSRSYNSHLRDVDSIFTAQDVFGLARAHFKAYGSLLPVSAEAKVDLLHCTYPLPVRMKGAAAIYTIHDIVPLKLPYLSEDNKRYHYRMLSRIARDADLIVTVSETSRRDIVDFLRVDERRVVNTFQSVTVPRVVLDKPVDMLASEIKGLFDLDWKNYLLFYGALEPKKNIQRLVEAFLAARLDMPLIIVGGSGWNSDGDRQFIDDERFGFYEQIESKLIPRRQIRRFDYLSGVALMSLVKGARAVVFPSLYEGFGLPIVEAMQLGTAVVASTEGSSPEIAGDAAILVNPYDTDELKNAIRAVACDDDLCNGLTAAGLMQARKFSPDIYRKAVRDLYSRVL
jgi:glycosyltransferase involved in cell wall biosynthesis